MIWGVKKIVLIGGEPTLYSDLDQLIRYINSKKIKVSIATNGRKFSDKKYAENIVESQPFSINISLKGVSEEEYLAYTNAKGLSETIDGYKNLMNLGFKNVSLSYVIVSDNKRKFAELISLFETNDLNNLTLQFVKPVLELKDSSDILDVVLMGKFVSYIYDYMKNKNINYCIEISFPLCLIDKNVLNCLISENRITTCCHVPLGKGIVFDTDLKILPCNHFAGYPYSEESVGLKDKNEIMAFFNSPTCKKLRNISGSFPSLRCKNCELWQICGGGCFTRWFYQDPDEIIKGGE